MKRSLFHAAALIMVGSFSLLAAEQATFTLNSGQRQNGTIVYGRGDNNIVDGRFHLSTAEGERTFGLDEVAVIDFAGGTPAATEIAEVVGDGGLMVMRNGSVQRGQLHNLIGGDIVQWVNQEGARTNYPISSVSRLYLNAQRARTALNAVANQQVAANQAGANQQVGTTGQLEAGAVRVDGNVPWTSTGIRVRRGDRVSFRTTGQISFAQGQLSGPDGNNASRNPAFPVPAMPVATLIGKVGNGAAFSIGSNSQIVMPAAGTLMLGVNDTEFNDNGGFFSVVVTR